MTKLENFYSQLFLYVTLIIEKMMRLFEKSAGAFSVASVKCIIGFEKIEQLVFKIHSTIALWLYNKIFRITTMPWNWLIIRTFLFLVFRPGEDKHYLKPGLHIWTSEPGGGKSISSYTMAEIIRKVEGMASYFTSPVENLRLSEDGKYWYFYHPVINPDNYYRDGKKVLEYNFEKYAALFKDENHLRYNPRMNKGNDYNKRFVPEHNDELLVRQQFKHGIHIFTQQMRVDSQQMESCMFYHIIHKTVKGLPYLKWIDDGQFKIIPRFVKISSYKIEKKLDSQKLKLYRRFKLHIDPEIIPYFNTYAERNRNAHLKKDKW
jgi:hypothetical protein